MEFNILNEIYDAYKGCLEDASSMWKSEYCCSAEEEERRDMEDKEDLKYFESLLQKIDNNISNKEEKIIKILTDELCYCYCDNCEFGDWDKYQDRKCDGCYRKYQNWRLSEDTAKSIAKQIIWEIKNAK